MRTHDLPTDIGLLILRTCIGSFMVVGHGWQKFQTFGEKVDTWADPLGIGSRMSLIGTVGAEFVCAILLIVGLLTRVAGAGLAFTMAVAAFIVHRADDFKTKEMALLYFAGALAIVFTGPGRISLDHLIFGRRRVRDAQTPVE